MLTHQGRSDCDVENLGYSAAVEPPINGERIAALEVGRHHLGDPVLPMVAKRMLGTGFPLWVRPRHRISGAIAGYQSEAVADSALAR